MDINVFIPTDKAVCVLYRRIDALRSELLNEADKLHHAIEDFEHDWAAGEDAGKSPASDLDRQREQLMYLLQSAIALRSILSGIQSQLLDGCD